MSSYLQDFGGYTADSAPTGWTDRLDTDWTLTVRAGDPVFGDQYLEVNPGTSDAHRLYSYDAVDGDANRDDSEVLMRVKKSSSYAVSNMIAAFVRGSGSSGSEYGYLARLTDDDLSLTKLVNGTWTAVGSAVQVGTSLYYIRDEWWWIRFRVNGTSLKARAWGQNEVEPPFWHLDETDSDVSAAGWDGVWNRDDLGSNHMYVDYFGVGTNGDSVTLPVEATAQVNLNQEVLDVLRGGSEQVNLNQEVLDVLRGGNEQVNLNQVVVDVLRGPAPLPPPPTSTMETLMLESFESYTTWDTIRKSGRWNGYTGAFVPSIDTVRGRDGNKCLELINGPSNYSVYTELSKAARTVVVGFAVKWEFVPDTAADGPLLLNANYSWDRDPQLSLSVGTNGKLDLFRGTVGSGTLLEEGTTVLQDDTWYYIEIRAYIHDTAGSYEVRIDGTLEMSDTSVDTQAVAGVNTVRTVQLASGESSVGSSYNCLFDDVYMRGDATGDFAGGFLGPVTVEAVHADANGVYRQWTLSAGTDEYALIDEVVISYTDYLSHDAAGERVSVGCEALTGDEAIVDVMAYYHTSSTDGGPREVRPFCRNGGYHVNGNDQQIRHNAYMPGVNYSYDPGTNEAWAIAGFNAAELGLEVI
jgi:hypothetical protein